MFQVLLQVSVETAPDGFTLPGLTATATAAQADNAKFDLLFSLNEFYDGHGAPEGITGRIEFATDLFGPPPPSWWRGDS